VSEDIAHELRRRDLKARDVPSSIQDFVERHEDHDPRQLTCSSSRLPISDRCPILALCANQRLDPCIPSRGTKMASRNQTRRVSLADSAGWQARASIHPQRP
jgi:hypothetical protein